MNRKRILLVFGTRPEAIKLIPVYRALKEQGLVDVRLCVTGQHREMLHQVLALFEVSPDYDLDVMSPNQTLSSLTAKIMTGLDQVLKEFQPHAVVVQGDTTSCFCGALCAYYHQIPVAHVEAGLRTGDLLSPWPEEGNRQLVSRICRWHFAPTGASRENLISEGIPSEKIQVTGNTVIDSLFEMIRRLDDTDLKHSVRDSLMNKGVVFSQRPMILVTGHRRENFGEGFLNICRAINELAEKFPEYDFIYPVHLNPNVQKPVKEILGNQKHIYLIQPAEYAEFVELMRLSTLIISDSGGVQEEAPSLGKPVLVTRNTTERPEAVAAGTVKLVGIDKNVIIKEVTKLLTRKQEYDAMSLRVNPYGDGSSSLRIREILLEGLNEVER